MTFVKTDVDGIIRDTNSKGLLNTNVSALDAYKKNRKKSFEMDEVKNKVITLEKDVSEIKTMLTKILEKL